MAIPAEQNITEDDAPANTKKSKAIKILKRTGLCVLLSILIILAVNSCIVLSKSDHFVGLGKYRFFNVVTESMEPSIGSGSLIVGAKPISVGELSAGTEGANDGTVVTFKYYSGDRVELLTQRVFRINDDGTIFVKGDNKPDGVYSAIEFSQIVGIWTGGKVGFFGYFFDFFQSAIGLILLILAILGIFAALAVMRYVGKTQKHHRLVNDALTKSAQALSGVNLRYDNINEITAVMDVLGMVTETPRSVVEKQEIEQRLQAFVKAETIELPQTPETAAILDSLPAPDTPGSLAAALSAGATLRQAEDGETLVLTTMSGGKNILLTPIQTADGIILCQQGMRIKSDLAPNVEEIGITSMPASPEFFEGRPLEKNVAYPELPQPDRRFGAEMISPHGAPEQPSAVAALAEAPKPVGSAKPVPIGAHSEETVRLLAGHTDIRSVEMRGDKPASEPPEPALREERVTPAVEAPEPALREERVTPAVEAPEPALREERVKPEAEGRRKADARADLPPMSDEHKALEGYRQREDRSEPEEKKTPRKKSTGGTKKTSAPKTEEQKQRARETAARKKAEREAFLASLSPEEREAQLAEQKKAKPRTAANKKPKKPVGQTSAEATDKEQSENKDKE